MALIPGENAYDGMEETCKEIAHMMNVGQLVDAQHAADAAMERWPDCKISISLAITNKYLDLVHNPLNDQEA